LFFWHTGDLAVNPVVGCCNPESWSESGRARNGFISDLLVCHV